MRLLEAAKFQVWPEGGAAYPANVEYVFTTAVNEGAREIEMDQLEFINFLRAFKDIISRDMPVNKGEFDFWGVKIKRI